MKNNKFLVALVFASQLQGYTEVKSIAALNKIIQSNDYVAVQFSDELMKSLFYKASTQPFVRNQAVVCVQVLVNKSNYESIKKAYAITKFPVVILFYQGQIALDEYDHRAYLYHYQSWPQIVRFLKHYWRAQQMPAQGPGPYGPCAYDGPGTFYYAQPAYYAAPEVSFNVGVYPYWNESDGPWYYWYSPYSYNGDPCTYPYEFNDCCYPY